MNDLVNYDHDVGSFRYIKREFKTRLYESFLRQSAGVKALGQHFTPRNVVRAMVRMARPLHPGARICDPFCGVGGFLLELLMEDRQMFQGFVPQHGRVDPQITLIGYDKGTDEQEDERTIILAKANMLIYFSDLLADYHSPDHLAAFVENGLNSVFRLLRTNLGTFDRTSDEPYDLILTNPPYVTKGSKSLKDAIAHLDAFYDFGLKGTEGLALNWIVKNIRAGGEALVIVPDSLLRQTAALSALRTHCLIRAVVSLPTRTFYSTPRRTYILALEKKYDAAAQTDPVFTYIVGETGETLDTLRLPIEENDLLEMVPLFRQFRAAPGSFESTSSRCKVVRFPDVAARNDWRVDRWWSHEERVGLGLAQHRPVLGYQDFVEKIEKHAMTLRQAAQVQCDQTDHAKGCGWRKVGLGDSRIFSYVTTKTGWSKTRLHWLQRKEPGGDTPVYTAAALPVARVEATHKRLIVASNASPAISFAANGDGSAGKNFVLHDRPFYVTQDRTVLRVIDARIDPGYVLYALRNMKVDYGFDHTHKAVSKNLRTVSLHIPETESGVLGHQRAATYGRTASACT